MPDNRVIVEYQQRTEREPGRRKHYVGERFTVTDAATAAEMHPKATVVMYADGRKFVRTQDESLAAVREAEAKAAEKEAAKSAKKAAGGEKSAATATTVTGGATPAQGETQG